MAEHNETGREGELEAVGWLKKQGYQIIRTNWRWHHYELDIVAMKENELVVAEVKTRSANFLLPPEQSITKGKIRRITAAADAFIRYHSLNMDVRFDLIFVIKDKETHRIEHLEDAFYSPINR